MSYKLSIVIPAYNEEKFIIKILDTIKKAEIDNVSKEIVIVNDCSTDNTKKLVEGFIAKNTQEDIRLINHEKNQGKGAALHKGIDNATGDFVIIQDAAKS